MFKQLIVSCMAIVMLTVNASAATNNSLKAVFDELNYSLTVEWNQKDKAFYDAKVKVFNDKISAMRAQGLSNSELVEAALANVKDAKLANELRTAFTMIQINKMSESEASKTIQDIVAKSTAQGASWTSEATMALVAVGIVAAIVVVILLAPKCAESVYVGDQYICTDEYDPYYDTYYRYCRYEPIYDCVRYEDQ